MTKENRVPYRAAVAAGPARARPLSYLTLLIAILPLLVFRSIRRRRKAVRTGLCPKCPYDLRAHQSGAAGPLCPECGTPSLPSPPRPNGAKE